MKKNLLISILMTITTSILLGIIYPLVMTGLAQVIFPHRASGQLIQRNGTVVGSSIIGQGFTGVAYFHSRPSAAGNGYDASNSGGSNLGPTNQKLIDRIEADVAKEQAEEDQAEDQKEGAENPRTPVPIDLVTTSASGFDPDITPAAAEFQLARVAKARGITADQLQKIVDKHTNGRQFGVLGEARVNVLELNLDLDEHFPVHAMAKIE